MCPASSILACLTTYLLFQFLSLLAFLVPCLVFDFCETLLFLFGFLLLCTEPRGVFGIAFGAGFTGHEVLIGMDAALDHVPFGPAQPTVCFVAFGAVRGCLLVEG